MRASFCEAWSLIKLSANTAPSLLFLFSCKRRPRQGKLNIGGPIARAYAFLFLLAFFEFPAILGGFLRPIIPAPLPL